MLEVRLAAGMQERGQGSLEAAFLLPPSFLAPEQLNTDFTRDVAKSVLPQAGPQISQRIPFPHSVISGVQSVFNTTWNPAGMVPGTWLAPKPGGFVSSGVIMRDGLQASLCRVISYVC